MTAECHHGWMSAHGLDPKDHDLATFGWGPRWDALAAEGIAEGLEPGIVVRHDGSAVLVATRTILDQVGFLPQVMIHGSTTSRIQ